MNVAAPSPSMVFSDAEMRAHEATTQEVAARLSAGELTTAYWTAGTA